MPLIRPFCFCSSTICQTRFAKLVVNAAPRGATTGMMTWLTLKSWKATAT